MILARSQLESVETLTRELNRTLSNPTHITLEREDASTISHLLSDLLSENHERNADIMPTPEQKPVESAVGPAIILDDGRTVQVMMNGRSLTMPAQTAYDLYQAIGHVLSSCVQPFQSWPRKDDAT